MIKGVRKLFWDPEDLPIRIETGERGKGIICFTGSNTLLTKNS